MCTVYIGYGKTCRCNQYVYTDVQFTEKSIKTHEKKEEDGVYKESLLIQKII